jgi:hypothetical protein
MLATHRDLAYFSSWTNRFPSHPWLASLSRLNDIDFLEKNTRYTKNWPRITEAYRIWESVVPGFERPEEDLLAEDATPEEKEQVRDVVRQHLRWQGKERFLAKYVGWMRIGLVRSIFPDAHFICVDRDPRATLYSQMLLKWGFEDRPEVWEAMTVEERLHYYVERYLVYLDYKSQFEEGKDYFQLQYEWLVENPVGTMQKVCEQVNLEPRPRFLKKIADWRVRENANERWENNLSPTQIELFNKLLEEPLRDMGYAMV